MRYLYPETVLFLLTFAGLAASVRLPRWVQAAVSVVLVLGIASNFAMLVNGGDISRQKSQVTIGQLTAYRIAGDQVDPAYQPTPLDPTAGFDLAAMARFGSPALTPAELLDASTLTRQSADRALRGLPRYPPAADDEEAGDNRPRPPRGERRRRTRKAPGRLLDPVAGAGAGFGDAIRRSAAR